MKRIAFLIVILGSMFLQSCIELKPFRVGDNIDIKNRISYMDNFENTIDSISESICKEKITNIAISKFKDKLNKRVTKEGEYIAFDLKNKLWNECKAKADVIDNSKWIAEKDGKATIRPQKNYKYFIYGTYQYTYKGYVMFVKVINLKTKKTIRLFAKKICNKKAVFDIDTLHIPQEVVLKPLW